MSYNYRGISNNTFERSKLIYPFCYWDNVFTDQELDKMCSYFSSVGVERSVRYGYASLDNDKFIEKNPEQANRISKSRFYDYEEDNENTLWIFQKLNRTIDIINSKYYNFDLNGYDFFQYTEYDSDELGKYDFHMDTIIGNIKPDDSDQMRKLSITLLLNDSEKDFEGGNFEINTSKEKDAIKVDLIRGRMIIFPSFMIHRVTPVTKGKRKSLVIWVVGPKFR